MYHPTAHAKLRTCLLVFSTVSCLSIVLSLANSLCRATCSLWLNERKYVGRARDHVRNSGQIVGVVYAVTNQITHYHVVEN